MYDIQFKNHEIYGDIIVISIEENGKYKSPFQAVEQVKQLRRISLEKGKLKVRLLVNEQFLSTKEMEKWAIEEYNLLPKCVQCGSILGTIVFMHSISGSNLFCTQRCADIDFSDEMDKTFEEEEIDYL
jgi:endogenous inhibitor of DNA gyrase (YacG/DUF329 family)